MTLDPARRAEIEAWAAAWVERHAHILSRMTAPEPHDRICAVTRAYTLRSGEIDGDALQKAIDAADRDPVAFDALCWTGAERLEGPGRGHDLPDALRSFLADVLTGRRKRPSKRGRPTAHPYRDEWLFQFVDEMVHAFDLPPTRNDFPDSEHTDSACDIAAEALRNAGLTPANYDHIKDAWHHQRRRLMEFFLQLQGRLHRDRVGAEKPRISAPTTDPRQ